MKLSYNILVSCYLLIVTPGFSQGKTQIYCPFSPSEITHGWLITTCPYLLNYYTGALDSITQLGPLDYDTIFQVKYQRTITRSLKVCAHIDTITQQLDGPVYYLLENDTIYWGNHKNNLSEGEFRKINVAGDTITGMYKNGRIEGFLINKDRYHTFWLTQFKKGQKNGVQYFKDDNGAFGIKYYRNNKSHGQETVFYPSGKVHFEVIRKKGGYEDGEYPFYDEKGEIYQILRVVKGKQKLIRMPQN